MDIGLTTPPRRTLFAAFYAAYPPTGGAATVTYQLARHWPGLRMLVQIGPAAAREIIAAGFDLVTLRQAGSGERWQKLLQISGWCDQIAALAREFQADLIVLEGASWSAYHRWLLGRLRRAVPAACIVYHSHNVEYDLRRQKHSRIVAWLTRLAEGSLAKSADVMTAVSAVDAQRFISLYARKPVLLPNGVDSTWLRGASAHDVEMVRQRIGLPAETVLFMGSYGYKPNGEAIDFLVNHVFPRLVQRVPAARLLILGGEVPYSAPWLISPGLVPAEELPALIAASRLSVAPIFSGSGTRLKILESLAAGVPVIATRKGAEGLEIDKLRGLTCAETAPEFINLLATELERIERVDSAEISNAVSRYAWPRIVTDVMGEIEAARRIATQERLGGKFSADRSGTRARREDSA